MTFTVTEKQLRMGIAAVVALMLAAICVWVLWPSSKIADACAATGRTASGELIYPVNCRVGGVSNQTGGVNNPTESAADRCARTGGEIWKGECVPKDQLITIKPGVIVRRVQDAPGNCSIPGDVWVPEMKTCLPPKGKK